MSGIKGSVNFPGAEQLTGKPGGNGTPLEEQRRTANARRKLYLLGAAVQPELQAFVRGNCIAEEVERMAETVEKWKIARAYFRKLESDERGLPEQVSVTAADPELAPLLARVLADPLLQASYSDHPIEIKRVELDKLVACQRHVDLDYVEQLKAEMDGKLTLEEHARFCLLPRTPPPVPKKQQLGPNAYGFSSPNPDFRFLGGFARSVTDADLQACWMGGQPTAAVVLLVGYGAPSMNAYQVGRRLILSNGFHRAYALRSIGTRDAFLVVKHVTDPGLEFPPNLVGLPKEYLLNNPRPALIKDFFDPSLVQEFKTTVGLKSIQVAWNANQSLVPV